MTSSEKAKEIIEKVIYITLATVSKVGRPWNSPVYSAYDGDFSFYWASWKENQHSINIHDNANVFIVIYDSTAPEGMGEGVYIEAEAYELTDPKEIEHGLRYLYKRKNKKLRNVEEFMGNYPRRVYKADPKKFWISGGGEINGNYIDTRVKINL